MPAGTQHSRQMQGGEDGPCIRETEPSSAPHTFPGQGAPGSAPWLGSPPEKGKGMGGAPKRVAARGTECWRGQDASLSPSVFICDGGHHGWPETCAGRGWGCHSSGPGCWAACCQAMGGGLGASAQSVAGLRAPREAGGRRVGRHTCSTAVKAPEWTAHHGNTSQTCRGSTELLGTRHAGHPCAEPATGHSMGDPSPAAGSALCALLESHSHGDGAVCVPKTLLSPKSRLCVHSAPANCPHYPGLCPSPLDEWPQHPGTVT